MVEWLECQTLQSSSWTLQWCCFTDQVPNSRSEPSLYTVNSQLVTCFLPFHLIWDFELVQFELVTLI